MGLTIAAGDPFATFITGVAVGSVGWMAPLYAFGRGSSGVSSVLYIRNGDTGGSTPRGEDVYVRAADAQTSLEVAGTRPV